MAKKSDKVVETFSKALFQFTDEVVDVDHQISFVHQDAAVKKILLHYLKTLQFDSDEEMLMILDLWKRFSKTSKKLGAIAVFANLEEPFHQFWQFYKIYIEALMENNMHDKIPTVLENCAKNCELSLDEIKRNFGPKFAGIFPSEEEDTLVLVKQVQPTRKSTDHAARVQRRRSSIAPPKLDMVIEKSIESSLADDRDIKPTDAMIREVFGDTVPLSQGSQQNPMSQPEPVEPIPKRLSNDFSIFCDPPPESSNQQQAKLKSAHYLSPGSKKAAVPSPAHKRSRPTFKDDESLDLSIDLHSQDEKENHKSFDVNSPTVCGLGNPNKLSMMTSTPDAPQRHQSVQNAQCIDFNREPSPLDLSAQVASKPAWQPMKMVDLDQNGQKVSEPNLERVLGRLSIAAPYCESPELESTVNASLEFNGDLNPWDENARLDMVRRAQLIVNQHDFTKEKAPRIDVNHRISLGGEALFVKQLLGHGGFAKVFKATTDDDTHLAIKLQKPACPYEVHMVASVNRCMPDRLKPFVMQIRDAYIFSDASAILYDFHKYGTALDLANTYKRNQRDLHGAAVTLIGIQLAEVLNYVHKAEIIHADIKPDNLLMCESFSTEIPAVQMLDRPLIKLIDFGRAIDMKYFKGQEFRGRAKTKSFECCEMLDGRPWTYQTDYFGFAASLYLLMMNNYMEVRKEGNKYKPTIPVKRRLTNRHVFVEIFDQFLNIPDCKSLPNWGRTVQFMTEQFLECQRLEPIPFRNGIQALCDMIKHVKP